MIIEEAKTVLKIEADGILGLIDRVGAPFQRMVELAYRCRGRVIVGGIGKSGIVGRKIVATLNSTGTRSLFLHPVEAMHGDLGMVGPDDLFIGLSTSGETDELNLMLSSIRKIGCKMVAFTGNLNSTLARQCDIVIDVGVEKEACPLGLAPTASSTAMLAMGDALAVVLINKKHFKSDDFKKFHPGGALGQRLAGKVRDMMLTGESIPQVGSGTAMAEAIAEMDHHSLGVILIVDGGRRLTGIITDGDIRRCVAQKVDLMNATVDDIMTRQPRHTHPGSPAYDALNIMEQNEITTLPIVDDDHKVLGVLHLHDILGKGAFKFNGS